jgi:3,4-dihydroxy 2-butanone 4-phosphate synthase / GTP cyclohydrolase II
VSVDAARGITTGISAADRARTIQVMAAPTAVPDDLVQPGHVFPLRAKPGGVLQRAGHTEAAVDLVHARRVAGPSASLRNHERRRHHGAAAAVVEIRQKTSPENLHHRRPDRIPPHARKTGRARRSREMPTDYGDFDLHLYRSKVDGQHHLALVRGDVAGQKNVLVRVHSECLTGDVFGSRRCDCGPQLHQAMRQVAGAGRGVIVYMRQEGRGIGLAPKIKAYKLQEQGYDTVEANQKLGYGMDLREYGLGAQILVDLGLKTIRLLTNNPKKVVGLEGYGLKSPSRCRSRSMKPNPHNERYLKTKREKMGQSGVRMGIRSRLSRRRFPAGIAKSGCRGMNSLSATCFPPMARLSKTKKSPRRC